MMARLAEVSLRIVPVLVVVCALTAFIGSFFVHLPWWLDVSVCFAATWAFWSASDEIRDWR